MQDTLADSFYAPPPGYGRVRLDVQWDGRDFVGWQSQARGRSVQDTLHAALSHLGDARRPVAAGRTDAGVHALCMPTHVDVVDGTLRTSIERLPWALNALLPRDLVVLGASAAPGFHARFSCRQRAYVYRLLRAPHRAPLEEGRALHVARALDVAAMRMAGTHFVGRHDFAALATRDERQSVREIHELVLVEHGSLLEVHVRGESFLRHMVRALVGTLLLVGEGKLVPDDVPEILARRDRKLAGRNVAPHGLYFAGARYSNS
nr:tRNA pseudouridine(38-40) synthase TruA [Deinococcus peraridilitoris]